MPRKKTTGIKPADIEPTNIEPTEIKPTEIKPTEIKPTEIKPTEIKPLETPDIQPTKVEPTHIEPTDINKPLQGKTSVATKAPAVFSAGNAATFFILSCIASVALLFIGISQGLTFYTLMDTFVAVFTWTMFFLEIKKLQVTQADLDAWKQQILAKHPNYNKQYLDAMTEEAYKNILNKFSYWTHTFKTSFTKIVACVLLPVCMLCAGAGIVLPIMGVGGSSSASVVGSTYISDTKDTNQYVVTDVTAYYFETATTYKIGVYDKEHKTYSWMGTHTYSQSGSKVTVQGGYFTVKNGGKKLVGSDGSVFVKVS